MPVNLPIFSTGSNGKCLRVVSSSPHSFLKSEVEFIYKHVPM